MGASMAKNLIKSTTLQKDHVMVYDINQSTASKRNSNATLMLLSCISNFSTSTK